jgi:hypothetical protein
LGTLLDYDAEEADATVAVLVVDDGGSLAGNDAAIASSSAISRESMARRCADGVDA